MDQSELIEKVAKELGISNTLSLRLLRATLREIRDLLRVGHAVPAQDASVVVPEMSSDKAPEMPSDKAVVAHTDQTPDTGAPATVPAAPVEPETTPMAIAAATEVIVSPGDTLWAIAATRLGDPYWWPIIYAENRPELSRRNPDLIDSGITLRIPALAGSVNSPSVADLRLRTNAYQIVADDYRKLGNPRAAEYEKVAARWSKE